MNRCLLYSAIFLALAASCAARPAEAGASSASNALAAIKPFLGRWDLSLKTPNGERPSWIEVSDEKGQPKVLMVGVVSCAMPLKTVEVKDGSIMFLSPKGEEGFSHDRLFKGRRAGGRLVGEVTSSGETTWQWTGRRAPALKRSAALKWGKPIALFDGKDFAAWKFSDPGRAANWSVRNGTLIMNGRGSEIITTSKFKDFKLHVEFNCGPRANSGVYLRGRYEVQIETDSASEPPSHHTGGLYGFLAPNPELPRTADKWQSFDITLIGRTVTVVQNGRTVIDHQEIPGITGGALNSDEGLPGPIYLQGTEQGRVAFRNIVITPAQ
ncbi:MAG: 3-keto-disaccharide hydrolase [Candidatus Acidiferrales bacterium]